MAPKGSMYTESLEFNSSLINITIVGISNHPLDPEFASFSKYVNVILPVVFGAIVVIGLLGNLLVLIVIVMNQKMRNTTNKLILNLAIADLCFVIVCVPSAAVTHALPVWPFGKVWCKIVIFVMYVCTYVSVYTLVFMSFYRYLAVVHPILSMYYKSRMKPNWIIVTIWGIILVGHVPLLLQTEVVAYKVNDQNQPVCLNIITLNFESASTFVYGSFFIFGYVLPLSIICVQYGSMLKCLLNNAVPEGMQRAQIIRNKKRATKMVILVVMTFALCWLPLQTILMIRNFGKLVITTETIALQMAADCLACMNSCMNPILYTFLSDNFRRNYRKLFGCDRKKRMGDLGSFDHRNRITIKVIASIKLQE